VFVLKCIFSITSLKFHREIRYGEIKRYYSQWKWAKPPDLCVCVCVCVSVCVCE